MKTKRPDLHPKPPQQQQVPQPNVILTFQFCDNGMMSINSPLPRKEVIKVFQNVVTELLYQDIQPDDSMIVKPNIVPGQAPNG